MASATTSTSRSSKKSKTMKRKRNAPIVALMAQTRGMTRKMLHMGRVGFGLNGMFKGNSFKKGAM